MAFNTDAGTQLDVIRGTQTRDPKTVQPKWPGWPGASVYRLIVPTMKVRSIIGKKGETVKKLCQETRASVKVLDGPITSPHRIVLVSAKEEPEAVMSPAMLAVMRLIKQINGLPEGDKDQINSSGAAAIQFCCVRLLVASTQALSLIGKQWSTIKSIQETTGAVIRVLSCGEFPIYANSDDKVVELQGESVKVIKALESVVGHLRKFLVDHSVLPLFVKNHYNTPVSQNRQTENWADKTMLHPTTQAGMGSNIDRQSNQDSISSLYGLSYYGQGTGLSGISSLGRGPIITQVAQTMQIPLMYANNLIGIEGSNLSYIRHCSGAVLTVQDSLDSPNEITINIKGTSANVQAARQLIQECISRHEEIFPRSYGNTEPDLWSSYPQLNSYPPFRSQEYELQYPYGSSGLGGYGSYGGSSGLGGSGGNDG